MENVNKQRRNVISHSELGGWPSKWVGTIAITTEKTQIHFLSDILVAVASLDRKVLINAHDVLAFCIYLINRMRWNLIRIKSFGIFRWFKRIDRF